MSSNPSSSSGIAAVQELIRAWRVNAMVAGQASLDTDDLYASGQASAWSDAAAELEAALGASPAAQPEPTFTLQGYRLQCPGCLYAWNSVMPASAWEDCPSCHQEMSAIDITPPAASPAPEQEPVEIDEALRAELLASMEKNQQLGPSVIPADAVWTYRAFRDKPVIAAVTHDQHNRRLTCLVELNCCVAIDGVLFATTVANALNNASADITSPAAASPALDDELTQLRATVKRLNRRCQLAEAAVHTKVEDFNKRSTGALRLFYYTEWKSAEAALTALRQAVQAQIEPVRAQLRYAYMLLMNDHVHHSHGGSVTFAEGLIAPQIRKLEELDQILQQPT